MGYQGRVTLGHTDDIVFAQPAASAAADIAGPCMPRNPRRIDGLAQGMGILELTA